MKPILTTTLSRGRLFVLSGPSGVGKGTLISRLIHQLPSLARSVSATSRPPRQGEAEGVQYHFLSRVQFEEAIHKDLFLETAIYSDHYYGTFHSEVDTRRDLAIDVLLEIEVQGAKTVRRRIPEAILIFIQPPSMAELERRLRARGTEDEEAIQRRLASARDEQNSIPLYDYLITNDQMETALETLRSIITAERHRIASPANRTPDARF